LVEQVNARFAIAGFESDDYTVGTSLWKDRDCVITLLLFKKMLICLQKSMIWQAVFSSNDAIFKI